MQYGGKRSASACTFDFFSGSLAFLKRLWSEMPTVCPKCGQAELVFLHKKAKKSNNDWKCPACGEIYRTINLFCDLPEE